MPAENDWALYASHNDKSLMRNVIAYDAARRLGDWAARTKYVELVLNGRYQGVYILMETVKLDRGRVVVADKGLGGRYLAEMTLGWQARKKGKFFRTPVKNQAVVYDDPKSEDLSRQEAGYVRRVIRGAERDLYRGSRRSWRSRLQMAAAVDYVLLEELFRPGRLSPELDEARRGLDVDLLTVVLDADRRYRDPAADGLDRADRLALRGVGQQQREQVRADAGIDVLDAQVGFEHPGQSAQGLASRPR